MLKQNAVQKVATSTEHHVRRNEWLETPVKTNLVLKDLRQHVKDLRHLHARLRFMMNEIESLLPRH